MAVSEYIPSKVGNMFTNTACVGINRRETVKKREVGRGMYHRCQNVPNVPHRAGKSGGKRTLA